jgi:hypothetical protein
MRWEVFMSRHRLLVTAVVILALGLPVAFAVGQDGGSPEPGADPGGPPNTEYPTPEQQSELGAIAKSAQEGCQRVLAEGVDSPNCERIVAGEVAGAEYIEPAD